MNKIVNRLLIFFIGVPAFYALVFLLPFFRHLSFNIASTLFSAIGAVEFSAMLKKKNINISKVEAFILGSLAPIAATLIVCFDFPLWIVPLLIMAGASWALMSGIFASSKNLGNVINNIAGLFTLMIYPGFFVYWVIKLSIWEKSGVIFLFLLIVFFNDATAWLFGNLFGKNNRGIIPASPNKSIAGYAGGLLVSVIIPAGAAYFFPSIFTAGNENTFNSVLGPAIVLGLFTGIFGSLGDLVESAIKRSCDFKDSGRLMSGRGGILDSLDSIVFAAPVFFMFYSIFFHK